MKCTKKGIKSKSVCNLVEREGTEIHSNINNQHNVLGFVLNSGFTTNYKIILDWAHIIKKCKENLSMAIKNKKIKIEIMEKILYYPWYGKTDSVIEYLQSIPKEDIKSTYWLGNLIEYFERNRDNIPCYCVRKYLNLRNSSNRGEKANDLVI